MKSGKIIFIIIMLVAMIFCTNIVLILALDAGGTGGSTSGGTGYLGSGEWDSSSHGIMVTVGKTKNDGKSKYFEVSIDGWWVKSDDVYTAYSKKLNEYLDIPDSTNKNRNYATLLSYAKKVKNNLTENDYVFVEPYTKIAGEKYTVRQMFAKGISTTDYGSVYRLLANSASVGSNIKGYKAPNTDCKKETNWKDNKWCGILQGMGYGIVVIDLKDTNVFPKKASITIKKVDSSTKEGLSGAKFKICTKKINNTTIGGTCKTSGKTNSNGYVTVSELEPNTTYYIQETKQPNGYELNSTIYSKKTGLGGSTVDLGYVPNTKSCPTRLSEIKTKYSFTNSTNNENARKELYELYKSYPSYTRLLNFDNYNSQGISCSGFDNTKIPNNNKLSELTCSDKLNLNISSYREKYYWYLSSANSSGITVGSSTVKCKYTVTTSKSVIKNNESTIAGTSIWTTKENENVFETKITKTCTGYNVANSDKDEIQTQMQNESYTLGLSGTNYYNSKTPKTFTLSPVGASVGTVSVTKNAVEYEASVTVTYAWKYGGDNTVYYKKSDGSFVNNLSAAANKNNYVGPDYGFPTAITKQKGAVKFMLSLPNSLTTFFGLSTSIFNTTCNYNTDINDTPTCVPATDDPDCPSVSNTGKLNLLFRTIDVKNLTKSFPGMDGKGRRVGKNWCYSTGVKDSKTIILTQSQYNKVAMLNACLNSADTNAKKTACNERYSDVVGITSIKSDCSSNNNIVKSVIVNNNDSYNKNNENTPLISISLNSTNIENIREYNEKNSYDDYNLTCENGKKCKSKFLHNVLNGTWKKYGTANTSKCNLDYCGNVGVIE